jgi:energy-coupling factor transport system ATP-binding protein
MGCRIAFDKVYYNYHDRHGAVVCALSDVSLCINQGEFVAVIGHNGSGKSTLAKHINALLVPTKGCVVVNGVDTKEPDKIWDIRKQVAFVFQNPENQLVASTVEEDVAFGPENVGLPSGVIRERVDEALDAVGMYSYSKKPTHALSGGQKQRIAIAGALALHPECIVLDEPTAMLDPQGRISVMESISKLKSRYDSTIVLVTHNMEEAARADRVVVMDSGHIAMSGPPEEVFSEIEMLTQLGVGVPPLKQIIASLQSKGINISKNVMSISDLVDVICQYNS